MKTVTVEKTSSSKTDEVRLSTGWNVLLVLSLVLAGFVFYRNQKYAKDPLMYMIPNMMMFLPFREVTISLWGSLIQYPKEPIEPQQVPEIHAKDFSFEALRVVTKNFKSPAVVRGLFQNTTGLKRWSESGYLDSFFGEYEIPVVTKAVHDRGQQNRTVMAIGEVLEEIINDPTTRKYMFFPVQSRFQNTNDTQLQLETELSEKVNKLVRKDLELDRFWNGFGTSSHTSFIGSQMIVGRGFKEENTTTGTGWHCAVGNNWFIQVVGSKKWFFVDQEYSAFLHPVRGGLFNMVTSSVNMSQYMKYIPVKTTTIHAGDFLYNPDWEWHTIRNPEGLSIGCPIRETNYTMSFRNNFQYSSIALINYLLANVGIVYGLGTKG